MSSLERNPLATRSPSPRKNESTVNQTIFVKDGVLNFQYNEGRRNWNYVSPTYSSSVLGTELSYYKQIQETYTPRATTPTKVREEAPHAEEIIRSSLHRVPEDNLGNRTPSKSGLRTPLPSQSKTPVQEERPVEVPQSAEPLQYTPAQELPVSQEQNLAERQATPELLRSRAGRPTYTPEKARSVTPNVSRRHRNHPTDNYILAGPNFSPTRAERNYSPVKDYRPDDYYLNLRANQQIADLKRMHERELKQKEVQLERLQLEMVKEIEQIKKQEELLKKDERNYEYNLAKADIERKRREFLESKKPTAEDVERAQLLRQRTVENFERASQTQVEAVKSYKEEIDALNAQKSMIVANLKEQEKEIERHHQGLPVGTYHWDYKHDLAEALKSQILEKESKKVYERREDNEIGRRANENVQRLKEREEQFKTEEKTVRNQNLSKIIRELNELRERRQEEKRKLDDVKRQERELLADMDRRQREFEFQRKIEQRLFLSKAYENQLYEKTQRQLAEKSRIHTASKSPLNRSTNVVS